MILDLIMPKLDGADTFRKLKGLDPNVRAILCSGYGESASARQMLKEGVMTFLAKPFQIKQLGQAVEQTLRQGSNKLVRLRPE